jgi:hypothetical protein
LASVEAKRIKVEVLDIYPTQLGHCPHFNLVTSEMEAAGSEFCAFSSQTVEYPDEVFKSHQRAVQILAFLRQELRDKPVHVTLEMVDLLSPRGFLKMLRHRVLKNFAIIVNGRKVCEGGIDWEGLKREVSSVVGR